MQRVWPLTGQCRKTSGFKVLWFCSWYPFFAEHLGVSRCSILRAYCILPQRSMEVERGGTFKSWCTGPQVPYKIARQKLYCCFLFQKYHCPFVHCTVGGPGSILRVFHDFLFRHDCSFQKWFLSRSVAVDFLSDESLRKAVSVVFSKIIFYVLP